MTCRELGGACDQTLTAGTWDEMVNNKSNGTNAQPRSEEMGPRDEAEVGRETGGFSGNAMNYR
jgi:hypothetical protein